MLNSKYKLRYLPVFYEDLEKAVSYIAVSLKNIEAANSFINDVEKSIKNRLPIAESFEQYESHKERRYPYYRIYVGNFIIYYVVIDEDPAEKVMEVRRLLYNKQNQKKHI